MTSNLLKFFSFVLPLKKALRSVGCVNSRVTTGMILPQMNYFQWSNFSLKIWRKKIWANPDIWLLLTPLTFFLFNFPLFYKIVILTLLVKETVKLTALKSKKCYLKVFLPFVINKIYVFKINSTHQKI